MNASGDDRQLRVETFHWRTNLECHCMIKGKLMRQTNSFCLHALITSACETVSLMWGGSLQIAPRAEAVH
ncbi:hypothetical protein E2C01_018185 [Portunus trituberculatus]|uniref:Uncharacterized protein n=1 Tax=Portunus trituberculatus TaxID=210409 RepID=A0A5B7DUU7_PORTR|nr:hypothetical protein [Portunus trituberculatus]